MAPIVTAPNSRSDSNCAVFDITKDPFRSQPTTGSSFYLPAASFSLSSFPLPPPPFAEPKESVDEGSRSRVPRKPPPIYSVHSDDLWPRLRLDSDIEKGADFTEVLQQVIQRAGNT